MERNDSFTQKQGPHRPGIHGPPDLSELWSFKLFFLELPSSGPVLGLVTSGFGS